MYHAWGRSAMHIGLWWENQKEGDHQEELDVGGRVIPRWVLEKYDKVVWTGFIWLGIGTSGRLM
jgi:hypothetical protein